MSATATTTVVHHKKKKKSSALGLFGKSAKKSSSSGLTTNAYIDALKKSAKSKARKKKIFDGAEDEAKPPINKKNGKLSVKKRARKRRNQRSVMDLRSEREYRELSNQRLRNISKRKLSARDMNRRVVREHRSTAKQFSAMRFIPFAALVREKMQMIADDHKLYTLGADGKRIYPRMERGAVNILRSMVEKYGVDTMELAGQNKMFKSSNTLKVSERDFKFAQVQICRQIKYGPQHSWSEKFPMDQGEK